MIGIPVRFCVALLTFTAACAWVGAPPAQLRSGAENIWFSSEADDFQGCQRLRDVSVQDGFFRSSGAGNVRGSFEGATIRIRNAALAAGGNAVLLTRAECYQVTDSECCGGPECNVRGTVYLCAVQ